jgi:hypothetical protein
MEEDPNRIETEESTIGNPYLPYPYINPRENDLRKSLSSARDSYINKLSNSIKTGQDVRDKSPKNADYQKIIKKGKESRLRNFKNIVTKPQPIDTSQEFQVNISRQAPYIITRPVYS